MIYCCNKYIKWMDDRNLTRNGTTDFDRIETSKAHRFFVV